MLQNSLQLAVYKYLYFLVFIIIYFTSITHKLPIFKPITFLCYYIYFSLLPYNVRFTQLRLTVGTVVGDLCVLEIKYRKDKKENTDAYILVKHFWFLLLGF